MNSIEVGVRETIFRLSNYRYRFRFVKVITSINLKLDNRDIRGALRVLPATFH